MNKLDIILVIIAIIVFMIVVTALVKGLLVLGIAGLCYYCIVLGNRYKIRNDNDV